MAYLKRHKVPKNWPVERKGTTYLVRPLSDLEQGVPVLVVLRDVLKTVQNRKEAKKIIREKQVLLNDRPVRDEKESAVLFDIITIIPLKKNYKVVMQENKKFGFVEIDDKEAQHKIAKVINRTMLKGKKMQINLSDGRNFLSDLKCKVNDSVLINLKTKKIEECLPLKEKAKVLVFSGKYAGKEGVIEKINAESGTMEVKLKEGSIHVLIKQVIVTG